MTISCLATRIADRYARSMSRRWRRLSRMTKRAIWLPACPARPSSGNSGTSVLWNWTSSLIAHTRCIVCTIGASSGPSTRTAKSIRGGLCRGVFMSSMMLIPPTNATPASTWHSLRCSRRSRWKRNCHGATSGRYLSSCTPLPHELLLQRRREVVLGAPAVDHHPHLDPALRGAGQRRGDGAPDLVVGVEVGLQPHFLLRAVDRRDQRRKILVPAPQQREAIAGRVAVHRRRFTISNVAPSAAWSDSRPHGNA